jgi:hypothetical protein
MVRAAVASIALEIHRIQPGHWLGFGFVFVVFAEFRRAVAAEPTLRRVEGQEHRRARARGYYSP